MSKIAIDFGTTRIKIARYNEEKKCPHLIKLGRDLGWSIPCLFHIPKEGDILTGDDAQDAFRKDPAGTVRGLKMELNKAAPIRRNGRRIERIKLASLMFEWIRKECNNKVFHTDPATDCILTVPPSFGQFDVDCLKKAAEFGGFERVETIEEPVSAAMHWLISADAAKDNRDIVVCDIGGGTSDIALVQKNGTGFLINPNLPPIGIPQGGNAIDELLFDSLDIDNIPQKFHAALLLRVKHAKELLTKQGDLTEKCIGIFSNKSIKISKKMVVENSAYLIEKVSSTLDRFAQNALNVENLNIRQCPLLLVGGGKNVVGLKDSLEKMWPKVYVWEESEQATVLGALISSNGRKPPSPQPPPEALYRQALLQAQPFNQQSVKDLEKLACKIGIEVNSKLAVETKALGYTLSNWLNATTYTDEAFKLYNSDFSESELGRIIELCNTSIQFCDKLSETFYLKALALEKNKKYRSAIKALSQCLSIEENNRQAYFSRGRCHMQLKEGGSYKRAYDDFTKALETESNPHLLKIRSIIKDYEILKFRAYVSYSLQRYDDCTSDLYKIASQLSTQESSRAIYWAIIGKLSSSVNPEIQIESYKKSYEAVRKAKGREYAINNAIEQEISTLDDWYRWFENISDVDDFLDFSGECLLDALFRVRNCLDRDSIKQYYEIVAEVDWFPGILRNGNLMRNDFDFVLSMASVCAEYKNTEATEKCLKKLWETCPDTDFREVVKDKHIKSIVHKTDLSPKLTYELSTKMFNKYYKIKNESVYDVNNVKVKTKITGKNDEVADTINNIAKLKAGHEVNLYDYLPNIGIKKWNVDISCDEMN
jgi:tetratricopeptide (TPR) repeat protein